MHTNKEGDQLVSSKLQSNSRKTPDSDREGVSEQSPLNLN